MSKKSISLLKEYQINNKNRSNEEFIDGFIDFLDENLTPVIKINVLKNGKPYSVFLTQNGNLIDISSSNEITVIKKEEIENNGFKIISIPDDFENSELNSKTKNAFNKFKNELSKFDIKIPISFKFDDTVGEIVYINSDRNIIRIYNKLLDELYKKGLNEDEINDFFYEKIKHEIGRMIWYQVVNENNFLRLSMIYNLNFDDPSGKFADDFCASITDDFWSAELEELINHLAQDISLLSKKKKKISNNI